MMAKPTKLNVYNTKITNHWGTPKKLYDELDSEHHFSGFDPCPLLESNMNGLEVSWGNQGDCVFCNPPYSDIKPWCMKAREQQLLGIKVVMLLPSRTSTNYFHDWIQPFAEVRFLRGRVAFVNQDGKSQGPAPFASTVVVFK
jgi:site-specific DNA-methyltransferase (adenine-specific)